VEKNSKPVIEAKVYGRKRGMPATTRAGTTDNEGEWMGAGTTSAAVTWLKREFDNYEGRVTSLVMTWYNRKT